MASETKLYAVPAEWPQPEFALGETVYDVRDRGQRFPAPAQVVGLIYRPGDESSWGDWVYVVVFEGYGPEEWGSNLLTREAWEYTPPALTAPGGPQHVYPVHDDFDPFLDADDLP